MRIKLLTNREYLLLSPRWRQFATDALKFRVTVNKVRITNPNQHEMANKSILLAVNQNFPFLSIH